MPVEPVLRDNLIRMAESYAAASGGIPLTLVSRRAYGAPGFFDDVKAGRAGFTARKYDEIEAWFRRHWPEGADFPALAGL